MLQEDWLRAGTSSSALWMGYPLSTQGFGRRSKVFRRSMRANAQTGTVGVAGCCRRQETDLRRVRAA